MYGKNVVITLWTTNNPGRILGQDLSSLDPLLPDR